MRSGLAMMRFLFGIYCRYQNNGALVLVAGKQIRADPTDLVGIVNAINVTGQPMHELLAD